MTLLGRTDFVRDLLAYVVVVGIVIAVSMDGQVHLFMTWELYLLSLYSCQLQIHVYESVAFLAAYVAYIAAVVGLGYVKVSSKKLQLVATN